MIYLPDDERRLVEKVVLERTDRIRRAHGELPYAMAVRLREDDDGERMMVDFILARDAATGRLVYEMLGEAEVGGVPGRVVRIPVGE